MSVFAAVMTGKGTGAISTIEVFGDSAKAIIKKLFKPAGGKKAVLKPGKILLGVITDESEIIDQVTIGCEGNNSFTINCHGNPLIVEMIMRLLRKEGTRLVTTEELLAKTLTVQKCGKTIAIEAKLAQLKARTIEGAKIIANQIEGGLSKKAAEWLGNIEAITLDEIKKEAGRILKASRTARLIVDGCTAIIAGPPNSGKSTLLNCLAGREKAIVTEIKGTTRDWVSAECEIGGVMMKIIDTAGIDEKFSGGGEGSIEKVAQEKSVNLLKEADLVLLVLDNSQTIEQLNEKLIEKISKKKIVTILNKIDLKGRLEAKKLAPVRKLSKSVKISAKFGTGIENLVKKIQKMIGVDTFDTQQPVCITGRQEELIKKLKKAKSKSEGATIITELLNGRLGV
ncbi:MAG: GTPase [Sedimentisphaerales bacterium]